MIFPKLPAHWLVAECSDQASADRVLEQFYESTSPVVAKITLLGPIDFRQPWVRGLDTTSDPFDNVFSLTRQDMFQLANVALVIVAGQVGKGAKPMHPDWVRSIRDQCVGEHVPFWFAGWGEYAPDESICASIRHKVQSGRHGYRNYLTIQGEWDGCGWGDKCECLSHVGPSYSGRILDGRIWDELPVVTT